MKVQIINNTLIDIKKFGISYKVYDEYNELQIFMFLDKSIRYRIKPGKSDHFYHHLPGNCDNFSEEGGWYIVGNINEFSVEAKDPSITMEEILEHVIWSNGGVLSFKHVIVGSMMQIN